MIQFLDGKQLEAPIHFLGRICTIYTQEKPDISGFCVDGFDCSDFTTLYRSGNGWYQLSNDGIFADENSLSVIPLEEYQKMLVEDAQKAEGARRIQEIERQKAQLQETDYIIIKAAEGCDMSGYDMEQIRRERQELRNSINALRAKGEEGERGRNFKRRA